MQFVRELRGLPVAALQAALAANSEPFQASELYVVATASKVVDTTQRISSFRLIRDPALFALCDALVATLSQADMHCNFTLRHNDVTHIVYETGGFFREHRDFLSTISNALEEYTLLVCVTPPSKLPTCSPCGGETCVTVNPLFTLKSNATTMPGGGLLFRKDLTHEGLAVTSGEKHLISLNLWATRKVAGPVLLFTFPNEDAQPSDGSEAAPLEVLAMARSYALSVAQVAQHSTCILNVSAELILHELGPNARVLPFECRACSYDAFGVVFKALSGIYVSTEELLEHVGALDFFGISLANVLVATVNADNAVPSGAPGELAAAAAAAKVASNGAAGELRLGLGARCCAICSRSADLLPPGKELRTCIRCAQRSYCSKACADADAAAGHAKVCSGMGGFAQRAPARRLTALADADIIVCTSSERALVVAEAAKRLGLPYVRFRLLFVEGTIAYAGDIAYSESGATKTLKMQPVWASLGDYDNILGARNMCHTGDQPDKLCEPAKNDYSGMEWPALKSALGNAVLDEDGHQVTATSTALDFVITRHDGDETEDETLAESAVSLPGGDDVDAAATPAGALFHVDSTGAACFSAAEAVAATQHLVDSNFVAVVQARIKGLKLNIPQLDSDFEEFFCNETVYGKCNCLEIMGVVRLAAP